MGLGLLILLGVFLFPLWQITLEAAQFPGGLRLNIWINQFSGDEGGGDIIKNINILNHYIGMQYIEPDSIPELKYFPIVVWGMAGLGRLTILLNRFWAYFVWGGILGILCLLGVYDFYLWLYDYGHNLDPQAPIKIEDMVYMPPLFGEKDLLNFYVKSYPRMGTIAVALSLAFSFFAAWVTRWTDKRTT
jgi:copper chaperone NosL